ncbi:hypothetical protein [Hymenobacter profundi]|uniref:RNA helicase n=1 Tax=Hymenobacter profundi TaxID=1982110 RepID=A0ABS6WY63_9BACT|nr:hypothetical protein [Hymenobacter profundi]MBW3128542.1 hypothetical protein [Hymenobacter profundi]
MADATNSEQTTKQPKEKPELPHCGVIMPISGTTDYPANHWSEMLQLVREAAQDAKFTCELVSATGRDDIIHSSIVTNIYENEIVVCDVSSRNPNVMLELGLRLASKLPVVVIFDEQGNYPFDINAIRYIDYRKDMRYYDTQTFKKKLSTKLSDVYKTYKDGKYKTFLSQFKNIDFNLDNISTETQTLKQFMKSINNRLDKIERNGNKQIDIDYKEKLSSKEENEIYKAIHDLERLGVFKIKGQYPDKSEIDTIILHLVNKIPDLRAKTTINYLINIVSKYDSMPF